MFVMPPVCISVVWVNVRRYKVHTHITSHALMQHTYIAWPAFLYCYQGNYVQFLGVIGLRKHGFLGNGTKLCKCWMNI